MGTWNSSKKKRFAIVGIVVSFALVAVLAIFSINRPEQKAADPAVQEIPAEQQAPIDTPAESSVPSDQQVEVITAPDDEE